MYRSMFVAALAISSFAFVACSSAESEGGSGSSADEVKAADPPPTCSLTDSQSETPSTFPCSSSGFKSSCKTSGGSLCSLNGQPNECLCKGGSASAGVPALPSCRPKNPSTTESASGVAESGTACGALSCPGKQVKCQVVGSSDCGCQLPTAPPSTFPTCPAVGTTNDQGARQTFACPKSAAENPCASSNGAVCKENIGDECACL
jgi:hypothetical protein